MPTALGPAPWARTPAQERPADRPSRFSGFRPEVQGLRFVAVLLVVVYHVFLDRVSGGVDIFLLISAFFLTLSFVRKLEAGRPLALGRYWLHVFKRLLPLAVLTILGTLVLVALFYPEFDVARWRSQALASVFYVENWALAVAQVDYYAVDDSGSSPFQHFWSLSVQGQVFLLWPVIFAAAAVVCRRFRWRPVPVLAVAFGAVFVGSLVFSVVRTAGDQAFTYFDTRARLWEFALGSLLALAVPYLNPARGLRVVLGWAGLVSMVLVGVLVDVQGAFPGWIALWPLCSAAAVIVAGSSGSRFGVDRILASGPLVRLGDAAYALYLVHWPLLITYLVLRDRPVAGPRSGVVLIVVSLVLAVVATRWVENPLKRWAWPERSARRLAVVVVVCLGLVAVPVLGWAQADARRAAQIAAEAERNNPGAAALAPGFEYRGDPDAPTIPVIDADYWGAPGTGEPCPADLGVEPRYQERCRETVPQEDPSATVLLLGNSHVHHWATAVEQLARENGWRVVTYLQPGCLYSTVEEQDYPEDCATWLEGTGPVIDAVDPDLVLGQGTRTSTTGEELTPGAEARLRELDARGVTFVGLRDTPRFEFSPPRCAQENGADDPACTTTGHPAVNTPNPLGPLADELAHVATVDMGDLICPEGTCRPVVGNVHTYWDDDHLSIDYVRTLTPMLAQRLAAALAEDGVRLPGLP